MTTKRTGAAGLELTPMENPFGYKFRRALRNTVRLAQGKERAGRKVTAEEMAAEARPACRTCHGRGFYMVLTRKTSGGRPSALPRGATKRAGAKRSKATRRAVAVEPAVMNGGFPEVCGCARNRFARRHLPFLLEDEDNLVWIKGRDPQTRAKEAERAAA
jgi:hypothetical protein